MKGTSFSMLRQRFSSQSGPCWISSVLFLRMRFSISLVLFALALLSCHERLELLGSETVVSALCAERIDPETGVCVDRIECAECLICGEDRCDAQESCESCPFDCGVCPPTCGDGVCEPHESCLDCPAECGACPTTCNNGTCEANEDCELCPADCGACAAPERPSNPTSLVLSSGPLFSEVQLSWTDGAEPFSYYDYHAALNNPAVGWSKGGVLDKLTRTITFDDFPTGLIGFFCVNSVGPSDILSTEASCSTFTAP